MAKRGKLPRRDRIAPQVPERPMQRWSLDFISDQLADCRRFRVLNIVDDHKGRRLEVRVGIATGRVVVGDMVGEAGREAQAISGAAPNLAARLQQLAAPGQIVVDRASLDLIGKRVETFDLGEQVLKDSASPCALYAVLSLDPVGAPDPVRE